MLRMAAAAFGLGGLGLGCGEHCPAVPEVSTSCADRTQFGGDQTHQNRTCSVGQTLKLRFADEVFDPFVAQEAVDSQRGITIHYQMPLVRGDDLFTARKSGKYHACPTVPAGMDPPANCGLAFSAPDEIWSEVAWCEHDGRLQERWSYASDWKPYPELAGKGFEQVFHAALARSLVLVPGRGGSVHVLDVTDGHERRRLTPFPGADGEPDPSYFITGPITVDGADNVYFSVTRDQGTPTMPNVTGSWLVRVGADGQTTRAAYGTLLPDAPAADSMCRGEYRNMIDARPWPLLDAGGNVVPPTPVRCGVERAPWDSAVALTADGATLYATSRADGDANYGYVLALDAATLLPRWTRSLRGLVHDGCGVLTPYHAAAPNRSSACTDGAPMGIDPRTGSDPALHPEDGSTSSPIALPDGNLLYGALTYYNGSRGHLIKLSAAGDFMASYDFGWDVTPAVWPHDGTYSIIDKDNHYSDGNFFLTRLDANLKVEWSFQNTETQACTRGDDGKVTCKPSDEGGSGFEWCVNAPAVDANGHVYALSEDGNVYHLTPDGKLAERLFLDEAIGAAYTPIVLDGDGRAITLNGGRLSVIGSQH